MGYTKEGIKSHFLVKNTKGGIIFTPSPVADIALIKALCPIGSPLGSPGPLGDLFVDLGPL